MPGNKSLTRIWLKEDISDVDEWFDLVHGIYVADRITYNFGTEEK